MRLKFIFLSCLFLFGASAFAKKVNRVFKQPVLDVDSNVVNLSLNTKSEFNVIVFLSDICPISLYDVKILNDLESKYKYSGINIIAIFPNSDMNLSKLKQFKDTYQVRFDCYIDYKKGITKTLKAKITPEIFLINRNNKLLYNGLLDNAFEDIKNRRYSNIRNYLADVIEACLKQSNAIIQHTQPIGCAIF